MKNILKHTIRFVLFVLLQGLIVGQLPIGWGIHVMIYPLFLLLLPFDTKPIFLLILAFALGIGVDFFMNTYGLHASAAMLVALFRPMIYRRFAPRDDYDVLKEPNAIEFGYAWFLKVSIFLVLIHHFWFFALEYFKWTAWEQILQGTILSTVITLFIFVIIQIVFFKKPKN